MAIKSALLKAGVVIAPLLVMLALGGAQPALAASSTVVVATTPNPTDCGKYHKAVTDLTSVLNTVKKGKVLVCPGDYQLSGDVVITGAKGLTIMQAVKGVSNRPHIVANPDNNGLLIQNSAAVTLDGLNIDASGSMQNFYTAITFDHSSGNVRSTTLTQSAFSLNGIVVDNRSGNKVVKLAVTNTIVSGYRGAGVAAMGPVRLTITSSQIDGTRDGIFARVLQIGVSYDGETGDQVTPTGTLSKSTIRGNNLGVLIAGTSRVTISNNTLDRNNNGVRIEAGPELSRTLKAIKVLGNSITEIPDGGTGLMVDHNGPTQFGMLNMLVSNNQFSAADPHGIGIMFRSPVPAARTMTGTVIGNTVNGFLRVNSIVNENNFAGIVLKKNTINPPKAVILGSPGPRQ